MWSGLSSEKMNHANSDLSEAGFNSQASESLSNDDQDGEEEFDPNRMEEQVSGLIMGFQKKPNTRMQLQESFLSVVEEQVTDNDQTPDGINISGVTSSKRTITPQ